MLSNIILTLEPFRKVIWWVQSLFKVPFDKRQCFHTYGTKMIGGRSLVFLDAILADKSLTTKQRLAFLRDALLDDIECPFGQQMKHDMGKLDLYSIRETAIQNIVEAEYFLDLAPEALVIMLDRLKLNFKEIIKRDSDIELYLKKTMADSGINFPALDKPSDENRSIRSLLQDRRLSSETFWSYFDSLCESMQKVLEEENLAIIDKSNKTLFAELIQSPHIDHSNFHRLVKMPIHGYGN